MVKFSTKVLGGLSYMMGGVFYSNIDKWYIGLIVLTIFATIGGFILDSDGSFFQNKTSEVKE